MAFFEVEFPRDIAYGATGGPTFNTTINPGFSGFEQRNANWAQLKGAWTLDLIYKPIEYYQLVEAFFINVSGMADGFRFFDAKDYSVFAQPLGVWHTGNPRTFQLIKTYSIGGRNYNKVITKPITAAVQKYDGSFLANTLTVYLNGSPLTQGTNYTVDITTGIITVNVTLTDGDVITADFQFHNPVRFDSDQWRGQVQPSNVKDGKALISVTGIQLVEIRLA